MLDQLIQLEKRGELLGASFLQILMKGLQKRPCGLFAGCPSSLLLAAILSQNLPLLLLCTEILIATEVSPWPKGLCHPCAGYGRPGLGQGEGSKLCCCP